MQLHTKTSIHFGGLMTGATFKILSAKEWGQQTNTVVADDDQTMIVECTGIGFENKME